jgi:hypothetical protein
MEKEGMNTFGLPMKAHVRSVYLTSGSSLKMHLGKQVVELWHSRRWQSALAMRQAGEAVRALAWLGPQKVI